MRFRRAAVAVLVGLALTAVAAGSARAEGWIIEGVELTGSATVNVSGGPWTLTATTLGTEVELTAGKVECGATCTIEGVGKSKGGLTYTEVTVMKPAHCTASSVSQAVGTIATKPLVDRVIMDPSNGAGPVFDNFTPETGTIFVEIEFQGEECALNEFAVPVSGSATGQSPNTPRVENFEQSLSFGSAQQATGGGALTLGGGKAGEKQNSSQKTLESSSRRWETNSSKRVGKNPRKAIFDSLPRALQVVDRPAKYRVN